MGLFTEAKSKFKAGVRPEVPFVEIFVSGFAKGMGALPVLPLWKSNVLMARINLGKFFVDVIAYIWSS